MMFELKWGIVVVLVAFQAFVLGLTGCAAKQPVKTDNTRPACVTLPIYGSVIEQVMGVSPEWSPPEQIKQGFRTRWEIQDDQGTHVLSAILTPDGCVCATAATSHFVGGFSQGKLTGYLQGAAVAPVSDLNYTAKWLEPKITIQCELAFLFRREYRAITVMPDAVTWDLTCTRSGSEAFADLETTLAITSPTCLETPQ